MARAAVVKVQADAREKMSEMGRSAAQTAATYADGLLKAEATVQKFEQHFVEMEGGMRDAVSSWEREAQVARQYERLFERMKANGRLTSEDEAFLASMEGGLAQSLG